MKISEPISNNVNLNDTMIKIIQTLENLKIKRDKINQELEDGYQLREKIQQQLNLSNQKNKELESAYNEVLSELKSCQDKEYENSNIR